MARCKMPGKHLNKASSKGKVPAPRQYKLVYNSFNNWIDTYKLTCSAIDEPRS